jgi:AcrR family transcriptional regulator
MAPRLPAATTGASSSSRKLSSPERRAAIIEAAREVFCRTGLSGARMRVIAERAGITEPLLYRHFSSRDELYRIAVEDHLTVLLDNAIAGARRTQARADLERPALITALTRSYVQLMQQIAPLASVALYEDHTRGKQLYQGLVRPRLREAAGIWYRAITGQDLRVGAENVLAVAMLGVPFGVALDSMLRGKPVDLDAMAARIAKLFATRS